MSALTNACDVLDVLIGKGNHQGSTSQVQCHEYNAAFHGTGATCSKVIPGVPHHSHRIESMVRSAK